MAAQVTTQETRIYDRRFSCIPPEYVRQYHLTHKGVPLNGHIRKLAARSQGHRAAAGVRYSTAACSRMVHLVASGAIHPDATAAARRAGTTELSSLVYSTTYNPAHPFGGGWATKKSMVK